MARFNHDIGRYEQAYGRAVGLRKLKTGELMWVKKADDAVTKHLIGKSARVVNHDEDNTVTLDFGENHEGPRFWKLDYSQLESDFVKTLREQHNRIEGGYRVSTTAANEEEPEEEPIENRKKRLRNGRVDVDSYATWERYEGMLDTAGDGELVELAEPEEVMFEEDEAESDLPDDEGVERLVAEIAGVRQNPPRTYTPPNPRPLVRQNHWFRTGDLVQYDKAYMDPIYFRAIGKILSYGTFGRYLVQFDRPIPNGHNGKGAGTPGCCKWFYRRDLIHYEPAGVRPELSRAEVRSIPVPPPVRRAAEQAQLAEEVKAMTFAPGARVQVVVHPRDNNNILGKTGQVLYKSGPYVMIEFDKVIYKGHSGNGNGKKGHCWNIHIKYLKLITTGEFYIGEDYKRAGKNLKGQKVKVLARISGPKKEFSIVEFTETVPQGHSADGRGKKAHCLTIPSSVLKLEQKEKKEGKKTKTEKRKK
jgi:hypothetical protein